MGNVELNCDMGEGYGLYHLGDDPGIMPHIHAANVACGFHASDPVTMRDTVRLAKAHGVKVGAHPSLPDRAGFGRREMRLSRAELRDNFVYQIGALTGFLAAEGVRLNHVKPHGAAYGMAARDTEVSEAICDAVAVFGVPLYGMAGTLHETVAKARGIPFVGEFFADLEYEPSGRLIITREHAAVDLDWASARVARAIGCNKVSATDGSELTMSFATVCIHSDTPNAAVLAGALRQMIDRGSSPISGQQSKGIAPAE